MGEVVEPPGPDGGRLYISVSPDGKFYVPDPAHEEFLDGAEYVEVNTEPEDPVVHIMHADGPGGEDTYELKDHAGYGVQMTCRRAITRLREGSDVSLGDSIRIEPDQAGEVGAISLRFPDETLPDGE